MVTKVLVTKWDTTWSPRKLFHVQYRFEGKGGGVAPSGARACDDLHDVLIHYREGSSSSLWRLVKYSVSTIVEGGGLIDIVDAYYQTVSVTKTTFWGIFFDTLLRFFSPAKSFDLHVRPTDAKTDKPLFFGTAGGKPVPTVASTGDTAVPEGRTAGNYISFIVVERA